MDLGLKNKKVLVFGGSSGIGEAIAQSFVQEGAQVLIASRSEGSLRETTEKIGASGYLIADLSQPGAAKSATQKSIEKLQGLDVLVLNTGGPEKGQFLNISEKQWHHDFQNLWMSVVESLHIALPHMTQKKFGRVLAVTSLAAKEPLPNLTTSNGLRAGLAGLFKSVANEVAAQGVTLNLLLPGYTDTDRLRQLQLSPEQIQKMVPSGTLVQPSELGDLACFLASNRARSITGQSFVVDGGVTRSL